MSDPSGPSPEPEQGAQQPQKAPEKGPLEKRPLEKLPLEKLKREFEKDFKAEIKEHKEKHEKLEKLEFKEHKNEAKEIKPEKEKPEKEKVEKVEVKEGKNEAKELKIEIKEKPEAKELKEGKSEFEKPPAGEGPPIPEGTLPQPLDRESLMRHADALEQTARQLRHFIERGERPDLGRGPLSNEPDQGGGS